MIAAAALLATLRSAVVGFGARTAQVLSGAATATEQQLVTCLVNDLGDGDHHAPALVLDDFHEVSDPRTVGFFDAFLDRLPGDVRVVIGTRSEVPLSLARRRVRGQLAELDLDDLRLDHHAIRRVLAHDAPVTEALVEAVSAASGGWAAAVRLATTRIAADPAAAGAATPAPILTLLRSDLWRYLAEVVFDDQPDEVRRFLLETSILDELTPGVCAAVTGRDDGATRLLELERRSLFVARYATDGTEAWRYHDLFAAFLRDRLRAERPADEVAELHRRAAAALPPAAAVAHLLAAGDHERVGELAIEVGFGNLDGSIAEVVAPWIEALPSAVVDRNHRLSLLLAFRDEMRGRSGEVLARLEPIHNRLLAAGDLTAAAEIALEMSTAYLMEGELAPIEALLDHVPADPGPAWRHIGYLAIRLAWHRARGDWTSSSRLTEEAFTFALRVDDPTVHRVLASAVSCLMLFGDQGPTWAAEQVTRLAGRLDEADIASLASLRRLLAGAAWLQLDLEGAADHTRRCLAESRELGGLAWVQQEAELLLLHLSLGNGDHMTVSRVLSEVAARAGASPIDAMMAPAYANAALRSAWLRGERRGLAALVDSLLPAAAATGRPEDQIVRTLGDALVARVEGRGAEVLDALADAERLQYQTRWWFAGGPLGLERASILFDLGRVSAAIEAAGPALATAAELGPGILFADAAAHLPVLQRCAQAGLHAEVIQAVLGITEQPARAARRIPGTSESLSAREIEVLTQVALGGSNRDIAEALFISEVTVKSHLSRILRKLHATSRTHAVARARELHLL